MQEVKSGGGLNKAHDQPYYEGWVSLTVKEQFKDPGDYEAWVEETKESLEGFEDQKKTVGALKGKLTKANKRVETLEEELNKAQEVEETPAKSKSKSPGKD